MTRNGVLYVSYDGMLEPLGQSQVLAYLKPLAIGRSVHLISFEKAHDWTNREQRMRVAQDIADAGIVWHPLRYHKWPSAIATAWDIGCATLLGIWLVLRYQLRIVHARSYVPSVAALAIKAVTGAKYLFDMRGFWADERVDGGLWQRSGRMYRVAKWFERRFLLRADHVVSLTHAAVRELDQFDYLQGRMPPVVVIPTCADLHRFAPHPRKNDSGGFVLGYVGSAGTWYLFDEVVALFAQLLRMQPDAQLLVVNRGQHDYVRERLKSFGVSDASFKILAVEHHAVPAQMASMDAGVFFYRPSFSRVACAPTKLGEFLGCGIPCLSNVGVGDMSAILGSEKVGVTLDAFDEASLIEGLLQLLQLARHPTTPARCVAAAQAYFSLDNGVAKYRDIYERIAG